MNISPEVGVDSPTKTTPSVLSPTAIQVSQPLATETEDVRSPTSEKGIEVDGTATPPRVLTSDIATPVASPVASPIASPLSQALSHLSHLSHMSKHVASAASSCASPVDKQTVYESDLIAYSDYQASKLSFPVGCPVWYIYDNESTPDTLLKQVRYGRVKAVAMNVVTRSFVYKIEKENCEPGEGLDLVLEDHIAYATSCPVRVTIEDRVMDGEIICPANLKDFTGKHSYSVMLKTRGNQLMIEHDVPCDQVKYRTGDELVESAVGVQGVAHAVGDDAVCNGFTCW
ncbi:hypothetical protein ACHAXN_008155 [Cyclotella atomus]